MRDIIDRIDALSLLEDITLDQKDEIHKIRKAYDALSDSEKSLVSNYQLFLNMEKKLKKLEDTKEKEEKEKKRQRQSREIHYIIQIWFLISMQARIFT